MRLSSVASDWPAPDAEAPVTESWTAIGADVSGLVAEPRPSQPAPSRRPARIPSTALASLTSVRADEQRVGTP